MAITLRQESATGATTKSDSLTFGELDNNFIDLLQNKIQALDVNGDSGQSTLGQALANEKFTVAGGTGITTAVTTDSAGETTLTITNTVADTDTDTTYTINAQTDGSNANINLAGSDASTDTIQLVAGTGISLSVDSAGAITLTNTVADTDTDTTYSISAETATGGVNLRLTDSGAGTDDVKFAEGTGIQLTRTDANTITITNTVADTDTDTTYTINAAADGSNVNFNLAGSDASTDTIQFVAGSNITLTTDSAGAIEIAATDTGITDVVSDTTPQLGGTLDGQANKIQDVQLENYKETIYALSYGATITPDVANGNVQKITLTGNVAFGGFSNAEDGQSLTLIIEQDGTGNRTFSESLDSANSMLFAGGTSTLSTAGGSTDIMSIVYAGGTYYASLSTNFS